VREVLQTRGNEEARYVREDRGAGWMFNLDLSLDSGSYITSNRSTDGSSSLPNAVSSPSLSTHSTYNSLSEEMSTRTEPFTFAVFCLTWMESFQLSRRGVDNEFMTLVTEYGSALVHVKVRRLGSSTLSGRPIVSLRVDEERHLYFESHSRMRSSSRGVAFKNCSR